MDSKPIQYHWSKYTDLRSIWFGIIGNGGGKGELCVAGEGSKYFGSYINGSFFVKRKSKMAPGIGGLSDNGWSGRYWVVDLREW